MKSRVRVVWSGLLLAGVALALGHGATGEETGRFRVEREARFLRVRGPSGAPILQYQTDRPAAGEPAAAVESAAYTHPLYTPSGDLVTDLGPADHPHHRGLFCAWVQVEGEERGDWWGWGALAPKEGRAIRTRALRILRQDERGAAVRVENDWLAGQTPVLEETLTLRVGTAPGAHVVDYEFRFAAPGRTPVTIARNPFGGFCYRGRPRGRQVITDAEGRVPDRPDSVYNRPETNWPASRWYDVSYHQPDGKVTGVAVIDHPENPPSTWHVVRGIHMLNPCIVAERPVTIRPGAPLVLRYRVVAHDGPAPESLKRLAEGFAR